MNRKKIKHWTLAPRKAASSKVRRWGLGFLAVNLIVIMLVIKPCAQEAPDELITDAGPSAPPCPFLIRIEDQEQRCNPTLVSVQNAQLSLRLMMPAWRPACRPILSDAKGRLFPMELRQQGQGLSGRIGPIPEQVEPYTLRFIAWDERLDKSDACGLWADYSVRLARRPPTQDAGVNDAGTPDQDAK